MAYIKVNNYTRILDDGRQPVQEKIKLITTQSICKSPLLINEKKYRRPAAQEAVYRLFVKDVFKNRDFISQKAFNQLILQHFNSSATYYRKRMIELGYITERNKLIKSNLQECKKDAEIKSENITQFID